MHTNSCALLLALASAATLVSAQNDEKNSAMIIDGSAYNSSAATPMDPSPVSMNGGHHHHGRPILEDPHLEPQQRAYWEQYDPSTFLTDPRPANKSFLKGHMVLTIIAWCFLFPFCVSISGEQNPRAKVVHFVVQTLQSIIAILALFFLAIYAPSAPSDIYPGNMYGKLSIVMFFVVLVHWVVMAISALSSWVLNLSKPSPLDEAHYRMTAMSPESRPSQDSGHVEDSTAPLSSASTPMPPLRPDEAVSPSLSLRDSLDEDLDLEDTSMLFNGHEKTSLSQDRLFGRIMNIRGVHTCVMRLNSAATFIYTLINKPLFVVSFFYFMLGVMTFFRMGMGPRVFNVLAHVIKGGVFFLFGLVTLARYCGAFAAHGMAWNLMPSSETHHAYTVTKLSLIQRIARKIPSMEWLECFTIFFYGVTNVGLEHLGNSDGIWSHKDLQHASIAFMYIGGGLCGLLVETTYAKRVISSWSSGILSKSSSTPNDKRALMVRAGYSFNPIAAFTVFWTGVLMSKHAQELPLSTDIHQQWGVLLCTAAVFRLLTYLIIYLSAPNTTEPTRPFTEIITSFCLVCGGMVFIQSNSQTVEALMYRGLDSMFTLNVNVGCAVLIMSYEMIVWSIKSKVAHI